MTVGSGLQPGGWEANVHVVLVVRVGDDHAVRSAEPGRVADEDHPRTGGDEAVEKVLREVAIDLARSVHSAQLSVAPRVVDVHVEPVLMRDVLVHPPPSRKLMSPTTTGGASRCAPR